MFRLGLKISFPPLSERAGGAVSLRPGVQCGAAGPLSLSSPPACGTRGRCLGHSATRCRKMEHTTEADPSLSQTQALVPGRGRPGSQPPGSGRYNTLGPSGAPWRPGPSAFWKRPCWSFRTSRTGPRQPTLRGGFGRRDVQPDSLLARGPLVCKPGAPWLPLVPSPGGSEAARLAGGGAPSRACAPSKSAPRTLSARSPPPLKSERTTRKSTVLRERRTTNKLTFFFFLIIKKNCLYFEEERERERCRGWE